MLRKFFFIFVLFASSAFAEDMRFRVRWDLPLESWPDFNPTNFTAQVFFYNPLNGYPSAESLWGSSAPPYDIDSRPDNLFYVGSLTNVDWATTNQIQISDLLLVSTNWDPSIFSRALLRVVSSDDGGLSTWTSVRSFAHLDETTTYVSFNGSPVTNGPVLFFVSSPASVGGFVGLFTSSFQSVSSRILPSVVSAILSLIAFVGIFLSVRWVLRSAKGVK